MRPARDAGGVADAQQTLAQADYALDTLLERLEEEPEAPRWARPRGPG